MLEGKGWRCGEGGQSMVFISVVSVRTVKSVAPFGVFIPQE
jgi:hypothetical protein